MQFQGEITKSKLILCFSLSDIFIRFFHKDHLPKSFLVSVSKGFNSNSCLAGLDS